MPKNTIEKELLERGVSEVIGKDALVKKLQEHPEKVVIKYGVDPTRPDIHLGHLACLKKLRAFQEMGCKIIFLVGDFTAQIGDPTGKSKVRPELEQKEILHNMQTYLEQVQNILDCENEQTFEWIKNSDWFTAINDLFGDKETTLQIPQGKEVTKLTLPGNHIVAKAVSWFQTRMMHQKRKEVLNVSLARFLSVLRYITHAQLIERDMFQERFNKNEPLFLHEMMYPVLQGLDSSIIHDYWGSCDLEVGGTDQHFNMLMGREIMKMSNQKPQAVMTLEILEGTDGKEKMSKSLDNYIAVTDAPREVFGKTMSIPDDIMAKYFEIATDLEKSEIDQIIGGHPRDAKLRLAGEITTMLYDEQAAENAKQEFLRMFQQKGQPDDMPELKLAFGEYNLWTVVNKSKLCQSNSESKRMIEQGCVRINGDKFDDLDHKVDISKEPFVLQIGKRRFAKIVGE
jgi:tyrosyl-tRNA synthetase